MTKASILRKYFKKFFNLDIDGMSEVEVLRDFMKKKFGHDSEAGGAVAAVSEMIDNDLSPSEGGGGGLTKKTRSTATAQSGASPIIIGSAKICGMLSVSMTRWLSPTK